MLKRNEEEIKILQEGGKRLASILYGVAGAVKDGISTKSLDDYAREAVKKAGGKPSFLGYKPRGQKKGYPFSLCVSINDEVVHGLASPKRFLKEGDIVGLDLGFEYKKLHTDMALTVGVGRISLAAERLLMVAVGALERGIAVLRDRVHIGDYGFTVQNFVEKQGFSVVRELVGHGIGYSVHESPDIPNWGKKGTGMVLETGMTVALEPMVCQGGYGVELAPDGWTWKTKDGLLAAHFEHSVVIEPDRCRVLTRE